MGCVVDSVAHPARDDSDGCCYLTTAFLAVVGVEVPSWITDTSDVRVCEKKTSVGHYVQLKLFCEMSSYLNLILTSSGLFIQVCEINNPVRISAVFELLAVLFCCFLVVAFSFILFCHRYEPVRGIKISFE